MDAKLAAYKTYRNRVKSFMLQGGIKPYEGKLHLWRFIAYYGLFISTILIIKLIFFCVANARNILMFTQGVRLIFSFGTTVIKIGAFVVYRKDFVMLEKELGLKFERELENKKNQAILLKKIGVYKNFMLIVAAVLFVSLSVYSIIPTLNIILHGKYNQIYLGKYPFAVPPRTAIFWIIYALELTGAYFIWTVMNGVDNAFGLYCFQACGLLRLASQRLIEIHPSDPNYKSQLRECIETHQLVLRAKDALQRGFGFIVIYITVTNSIIMCTVMWQASQLQKAMSFLRAFYFISFVVLKLSQSFTFAYYGTLVSYENDNYQNAIYMMKWPGSGNVHLMKNLLLMLTQRSVILKACGYFRITMVIFEKIVNTTISYFFLLKTLETK